MLDSNYYKNLKDEISKDFQELVNESFNDIWNVIVKYSAKKQKLDVKMGGINLKEQENQKKDEESKK